MSKSKKVSDCDRILSFLETHEWISNAVAVYEFGCYRLPARIFDLKAAGNVFDDRMVYGKDMFGNHTHWKEYKLLKRVS